MSVFIETVEALGVWESAYPETEYACWLLVMGSIDESEKRSISLLDVIWKENNKCKKENWLPFPRSLTCSDYLIPKAVEHFIFDRIGIEVVYVQESLDSSIDEIGHTRLQPIRSPIILLSDVRLRV